MEKLSYRQAYDLIIDAYFKDEIKPRDMQFCICGTLHGSREWSRNKDIPEAPYTANEYFKIEDALFVPLYERPGFVRRGTEKYEKFLFEGMCAALEVLKEIHCNRGENVDEETPFKKRELQTINI